MKKFAFLITALFVMVGLVGISPASADTSITIESVSYSDAAASANVTKEERALIDGATQLTWWYPNHNIKVSKRSVRNAPHIKVRYTRCANQSKSIAKQARGKSIVVAMPGSVICNTGKNGNIIGGFKWTVKRPAVLKWNRSLRLYQHVYNVYGSAWKVSKMTLVKTCGNRMGGHVDHMYNQVVQVRYESDVQLDIAIEANASVKAKVEASLQCASGKLYGYAEASASATASATIRVKSGVKVSATNAKKIELLNQVNASAKAKAEAEAKAKITLTCTDTPTYEAPSVDVTPVACVEPGQTRDVTITVSNPNGSADTARVTYRGQTSEKAIAAHGQATFTFANQAAGTYSGTALLVNANKSKSFTVTVEECEVPPPYTCPPGTSWTDIDHDGVREEGECFGPPTFTQFREFNDLYKSLPGQPTTMDHFVTVDTPAGHSYTVTWTAVWGSFAAPTKTGQDGVQVSSTYTAPSEVPPAHPGEGLSAGYDKITVTVVDNVTGQQIVRSTAPFKIKEWPATP